jgi:hypothetical protein
LLTPIGNFLLWTLAGLIVLTLPGAAWLAWTAKPGQTFPAYLADAVGLSLATTVLVALLTFLTGLQITPWLLGGLTGLLAIALIVGILRRTDLRLGLAFWLTLLALAGVIGWRLYQARGLALPAWVDSVHHVLIVQAILLRGGVPGDLMPLLPVPFYYHFGFHALAALYTAWSGLPVERAVLIFGQVLNALVGLSVYRLGMCLWSDWRRSLAAGLLVTFAFHMPAYYLTWGRYPLLAGLIVLPLALTAAVEISRQTEWHWEPFARLAALTGGLFLSHYLTALLFGIFLSVLGVQRLWNNLRRREPGFPGWAGLIASVAVGVVVASPWIYRIWVYSAASFRVGAALTADAPDQMYFSGYNSYLWYLSGPLRNHVLLGAALVGAFFSMRSAAGRLLGIWSLLLGLLSLPYGISLGPFRPDLNVIVLFLPGGLLVADLVLSLADWAADWLRARPVSPLLSVLLIGAACSWGILQTGDILNPGTIFSDQADLTAIGWIQDNTASSARFFINTTPWQGGLYRGVDGGWWILPLIGRQTMLPPVVYAWGTREYIQGINDLAGRASQVKGCTPEFWSLVNEDHLDYAYLHTGQGSLQPDQLQGCPGVEAVYQTAEVWIFKLSPDLAQP